MNMKNLLLIGALSGLTACSGLLQNKTPEPDVYALSPTRLTPSSTPRDIVLVVAHPTVRAGLDSDHLAVTLADRRSDVYAGARWAAPIPRMVEGLLADALRSTDTRRVVVSERSVFRGRYLLQTEITEFTADYSQGSVTPTVRVSLRGELGIPAEHRVVAMVAGMGTSVAAADRRREVVAAYQAAWDAAASALVHEVDTALERADSHP
jgi:cholesterol transport system auxiliary component